MGCEKEHLLCCKVTCTHLYGTWGVIVTRLLLILRFLYSFLQHSFFFSLQQGMVIFLLHVLRNSEVRASFHHKLLKWRLNRFPTSSANRVHEDASAQTTSQRKWLDNPEAVSRNEFQDPFNLRIPSPRLHWERNASPKNILSINWRVFLTVFSVIFIVKWSDNFDFVVVIN